MPRPPMIPSWPMAEGAAGPQGLPGPPGPPGGGDLGHVYFPEDYGTVDGTGATSSLAALNAASDAAHANGGGTIILWQRYGIDGVWNIRGGVCVYQLTMPQHEVPAQPENGIVCLTAGAKVQYGQGGAGGSTNDNPGEIRNLFIDGDDVAGAADCLFRAEAANSSVYNLRVHRSLGNGVDLGSSQNLVFYNPEIGFCHNGVAMRLCATTLGQQGPGGNKVYGGHIGDSLVCLEVTSNGPTDFFPPHDNIFDGVLFETGRTVGEDIDANIKLESGETQFRACVFTIGGNVAAINEDCNVLVSNPIYTAFSTTATFDSCYFGAGGGAVSALHNIRALQDGAFNTIRLYGRTQLANADYFACTDGGDVLLSQDGPITITAGAYTGLFTSINGGALTGLYREQNTGLRFVIEDGLPNPFQMKRKGDVFNRAQMDRDGGYRFLDPVTGATIGTLLRNGAVWGVTGRFGFAGSIYRSSASQVVAADAAVAIDSNATSSFYIGFTVNGADATSVTISNPITDVILRIGITGTGENKIDWSTGTAINFDPTIPKPQPIDGVTQYVELVYVSGVWTELWRSHPSVNQTAANRVSGGSQEIYPREDVTGTNAVTSQSMRLMYFTAYETMTVASLRTATGGTAAGATPTTCKMGLYSVDPTTGDLTRIGITANNTALWSATNTIYTEALLAPVQVVAGKRYAFAYLLDTAAATPVLVGHTLQSVVTNTNNRLVATKGAQTDLLASYTDATLTTSGIRSYGELVP